MYSFAGSDSTASTMQSFFHLMLKHPDVYRKLQVEIDDAQAHGRLSSMISWNEAQALPWFQAALKESMRCRPAVGLNITSIVPAVEVELGGRFFEASTRLAVNGWVLHRDRKVFGEDADVYRPERWLKDEETAKYMERHMFQVNSAQAFETLVC